MNNTVDEAHLQSWIGKEESHQDILHVEQARLLQATLDQQPDLKTGEVLPPTWQWIYFASGARQSVLGRDGHPKRGEFLPPVPLPRRMWAGGRLGFSKPVQFGETITKTSRIEDVSIKSGGSGPLCFVVVRHSFYGSDGSERFWEEQDLVYLEDPAPDAAPARPKQPPATAQWSETIAPDPVLLFRYSALTFNSHRIHYDREYCRDVEGYPGLVVHGPLSATLLADLAVRKSDGRALASFSFRAVAPLFDTQPFTMHATLDDKAGGKGGDFWTQTPQGHLAMQARAEYR